MVFLSGERMNFLIRLGAGVLSVFSLNFKIKKIFSFILIVFLILMSLFVLHPPMIKIYKTFVDKIPVFNMQKNNAYWETWRGGIQQGIENPIIGLGVASHRKNCPKLISENMELVA